MIRPVRIQLKRTRGWRKPAGALVVARPTKWGNPFKVADCQWSGLNARATSVSMFRDWLDGGDWPEIVGMDMEAARRAILDSLPDLRGRDLACWCPLDQPCHADVLLELANR